MQQARIGPDGVVGLGLVELLEQQGLDGAAETARGDLGHFRRSVGRANREAARQYVRGIAAGAASEFENGSTWCEPGEKRRQARLARGDLAPGIGLGVAAVELQRLFVHRRTLRHGNSAICSSPIVSGNPNIRFMFWIACPAEPFTRLSSVEMTIARFLMRSATTPSCT